MAYEVRIDTRELTKFTEDLDAFSQQRVRRILRFGAEEAGKVGVRIARREYPPPARQRGQRRGASGRFISQQSPLRTERQIRWWWATMRGKAQGTVPSTVLPGWQAAFATVGGRQVLVISGQYKRTGQIERSLKFDVTVTGEKESPVAVTTIFADEKVAPYAQYVIGQPPEQAQYHQGHWMPLVTLLDRNIKDILSAAELKIMEQVNIAIIEAKIV